MSRFGNLVSLAFLVVMIGGSSAYAEQKTGMSMYIDRKFNSVWPFEYTQRWEAYTTITKLAETLFHTNDYSNEIALMPTESFPGFPELVLTDEDGNGQADFYAYYNEDRTDTTLEFGPFFTDDTGYPVWLIFNGGPSFSIDEDGEMEVFWMNYQFIDRNGDNAFDVYVVNGIDFDHDGQPENLSTAWVYDDNFDGFADRAEHLINGASHEIPSIDGTFQLYQYLGDPEEAIRMDEPLFEFWNMISTDIVNALKGE